MPLHFSGQACASNPPRSRRGVWQRFEQVALLATIPAFYLAALSTHRALSVLLYLVALLGSIGITVHEAIEARRRQPQQLPHGRLLRSLLLDVALLMSATLPAGDSPDLLVVRLGTAALVVLRWSESILPAAWHGMLPQRLALGIGVLGLCGLGFWWLEPRALTFGDGLWLAFTTAATVGYGDIVPSTAASKIFAVFVVLMGLAVLSAVTASIAALWVQTEERRIEQEVLQDLHRELQVIRGELAALRRERPPTKEAGDAAARHAVEAEPDRST